MSISTQVVHVELYSPSLPSQAINRILRGTQRGVLLQKDKALELAMINIESLFIEDQVRTRLAVVSQGS